MIRYLYRMAAIGRRVWWRIRRPLLLATRTIVTDQSNRVLLIRHSYAKGWHLPGGGVKKRETAADAARREVREETGLIVEAFDVLGVYSRNLSGASDHIIVQIARRWRGTLKVDGREVIDARFFPTNALPPDTSPATQRRLAEWQNRRPRSEVW